MYTSSYGLLNAGNSKDTIMESLEYVVTKFSTNHTSLHQAYED